MIYNCSIAATPTTCGNESFGGWTLVGKVNATTGQKDPACDNGTSTNCKDDPADLAFAWPVDIGISYADGETLRKAAAGSTLTATNIADDYATESDVDGLSARGRRRGARVERCANRLFLSREGCPLQFRD